MSLILALRQVDLSEFRLVTGLKEFQTRQSWGCVLKTNKTAGGNRGRWISEFKTSLICEIPGQLELQRETLWQTNKEQNTEIFI